MIARTVAMERSLRTERTVIRPFSLDDVPDAHPVFRDPEVGRFMVGGADATLADTQDRIVRYMAHQKRHGFAKWAVRLQDTGEYIGDAGIMTLPATGEVELGYRLARSHWGRGLATEIAAAWLQHGLEDLEFPRIIAFADPKNTASIRVLEKLGMTFHRNDRLYDMNVVVYETTAAPKV
jgi:ribosomal-protein-alanine N-acetyltransferase